MAAPTSTNEVTARKLSASISALWTKIKSTFQTLGNLVTSWGSTPSDTKYPSEKLVKTSLDGKVSSIKKNGSTITPSSGVADIGYMPVTEDQSMATVQNLIQALRVKPGGRLGSVMVSASTIGSVAIARAWYNYLWIPHRTGSSADDNQNFGTLVLTPLTSAPDVYVIEGQNLNGSSPTYRAKRLGNDASFLYANLAWGGAFRTSNSPLDVALIFSRNILLGINPDCVKVEYSTDGGATWLDYGLTDSQKTKLFAQFDFGIAVYCGKNTHIQPGYTGTIVGTKDLSDSNIADQRLRITFASRPFANVGTTSRTGEFIIAHSVRRIAVYMSTQSAGGGTHCKLSTRSMAQFVAGNDNWTDYGDFPIAGDSGWSSIPCNNGTSESGFQFGAYDSSAYSMNEIRLEIWSTKLNANPAPSQTGNLRIQQICAISDKVNTTTSKWSAMMRFGIPCTGIDLDNNWPIFNNGIKFTARKLKTNLARTADSTFDGSADQTNIPVTGTLPVANGGTGKSSVTSGNYLVGNGTSALTEKTPNEAANDLINALSTGDATPTGEDYYVAQFAGGGTTTKTYHRRPVKALWEYIKAQISSVLGLTATSYGGNAATATALASGSADRTKLDGIASGAEVNVQSDWNQATTTADDYIKNKPTLGTAAAKNVPTSGNASTSQVVMGNDTRLTDSRTPTAHNHNTDADEVTSNDTNLNEVTDTTEIVTTNIAGYSSSDKKLYRRPAGSKLWPWIKSKLGISSAVGSSTLPVYFDSNGQAKAIGSDLQVVKGSSDSEASVRAMYDGNNKIYLCSNSTTNGIAMYNGGTFKWMCSSDRNGNATFNGNATSATSATTATTASSANYLKYQRDNEINFKNVPSVSNGGPRTWFNYRNGDTDAADSSNVISDYVFGNRNNDVKGVRLHAEGIAFRSFYPQSNEAFFAKITMNSNGWGTIRFRVTGSAKSTSTGNDIFGSCDIVVKCRGDESNWHAFYTRSIRSSDSAALFLQGIYYESGQTFYIGVRKSGFGSRIHVEVIDCCTSSQSISYEPTSPNRGFTYEIGDFNSSVTGTAANMMGGTAAYNPANAGTATGSSSTPVFVDAVGKITACTSVAADTVDGFHIAVGSYGSNANTIYFY